MVELSLNDIQEHYIAYFDILGYKEFFEEQPEKVCDLLFAIHNAIQNTKSLLNNVNQSPIISSLGVIDIKYKIFSDNILICMKTSEERVEPIRLLLFLRMIADIQRGFVSEYGLFVRGGILKGKISFHDDYVFGRGLIDVVGMEESAHYPRIVVNEELVAFLQAFVFCSREDIEKNVQITERIEKKEHIEPKEMEFHYQVRLSSNLQMVYRSELSRLIMKWTDDKWILCYMNSATSSSALGEEFKDNMLGMIQKISPFDYQLLVQTPVLDFDASLRRHKEQIEVKLRKYGKNDDIAIDDSKSAEIREKILRKYIWVMAFHNQICKLYQKREHMILTECNCDMRFLKMNIKVLDNE